DGRLRCTFVSTLPAVSLTTVTRISRSGDGADDGGDVARAGDRPPPCPEPVEGRPGATGEVAPTRPRAGDAVPGRLPRAGDDEVTTGGSVRGTLRIDAAGIIAIPGETRTDSAGTTSNSVRFSPLKMSPSYRCWTARPSITSSPPGIPSVTCT